MTLPQRSYSWKDQESLSKDTLITRIGDLRLELPGYGYHRGTRQLHREWQSVNRKKVVRLLRERGWIYQTGKKNGESPPQISVVDSGSIQIWREISN